MLVSTSTKFLLAAVLTFPHAIITKGASYALVAFFILFNPSSFWTTINLIGRLFFAEGATPPASNV